MQVIVYLLKSSNLYIHEIFDKIIIISDPKCRLYYLFISLDDPYNTLKYDRFWRFLDTKYLLSTEDNYYLRPIWYNKTAFDDSNETLSVK